MIQSARAAITNTGNEQAQAEFSQKSDNVSIVPTNLESYRSTKVHMFYILDFYRSTYIAAWLTFHCSIGYEVLKLDGWL